MALSCLLSGLTTTTLYGIGGEVNRQLSVVERLDYLLYDYPD